MSPGPSRPGVAPASRQEVGPSRTDPSQPPDGPPVQHGGDELVGAAGVDRGPDNVDLSAASARALPRSAGAGQGGSTRPGAQTATARRRGDVVFRWLSTGAGLTVLALVLAITAFLVAEAIPSLRGNTGNFLTTTNWFPNLTPPRFGIAALIYGTVVSSTIALLLAVPVAVGVALFISHYAPRRLASPLGYVIDLLAAVPSVVYGLWGRIFLNDQITAVSRFLEHWFGWIPFLSTTSGRGPYSGSLFIAGVVLAIMILPIISAISREVFLQVPRVHEEAALALGATRWEMIRTVVLPSSRPGLVGASMLGLGRALGETIAVALVLRSANTVDINILESGGNTVAANIALTFGEATSFGRGALIASGLALFVLTLAVNFAARAVIARRADFAASGG